MGVLFDAVAISTGSIRRLAGPKIPGRLNAVPFWVKPIAANGSLYRKVMGPTVCFFWVFVRVVRELLMHRQKPYHRMPLIRPKFHQAELRSVLRLLLKR